MEKILEILKKQTGGICYKSFKYTLDNAKVPSLAYDETESYKLQPKKHGETDTSLKGPKDLAEKVKLLANSQPLFRYFLDGSRRTYKVDDIELGGKVFPIIGGQIGVACCERQSASKFTTTHLERNLVLALPNDADKDGRNTEQFFNSLTQKINELPKLAQYNLKFSKILSYSSTLKDGEKIEDKGVARIQDEMIESEKRIVSLLSRKHLLTPNGYLLKDGSLQYQKTNSGDFRELSKIKSNYQSVVGLSKSFNPAIDNNSKNASKIARLQPYHRTPAFYYYGDRSKHPFSIWYLRVRSMEKTHGPFAGVVKLEKVLVTDNEIENGLSSDEIDLISANIIKERNPVAYGLDNRWANHLYPIYLTERYVKSHYISDLHFLNLF